VTHSAARPAALSRLVLVAALVAAAVPARAEQGPATGPDKQPKRVRGANDKRRTVRSYGTNLTHNITGVLSKGNREAFFYTAAFTVPARTWDEEVVRFFDQHPHKHFGTVGATMGGTLAIAGVTLGGFAAGRMAYADRFRAASYDVSQAVIVTQLYTQALKFAVRRERPDGSNRQSFPSGHASNAFAVAAVLAHHYGPAVDIPAFGVASFIALSRCAANRHFFSDVFAGAGIGWGMGHAVAKRNGRPPDSPSTSNERWRLALAPDGGPSGDGHGLALHVSF